MANYVASARSNYFKVKDEVAFKAWCDEVGIKCQSGAEGTFMVHPGDYADDGCWPNFIEDDDGNERDVDVTLEIAEHLVDGEVAVFQEVGAEKLRFLCGYAIAVHSSGKICTINIDEIYKKAEHVFGLKEAPSLCEY